MYRRVCISIVLCLLLAVPSFAYERAVFKTKNLTACFSRLKAATMKVADPTDESGKPTQVEAYLERGNTPFVTDVDGNIYFTVLFTSDELLAALPRNNTPNYSIIWTTLDLEQVGVDESGEPIMAVKPRPTYEVYVDPDDPDAGTVMQMVGWI